MSEPGLPPRRDAPVEFSFRRPRRFGVGAAGVLAMLVTAALATCRDQPTAPGHGSLGYVAVRPVVTAPAEVAAFGLVVDSVRVAAIRPETDTLADTTVFFDPNAPTLQLALRVLLRASVETLLVHMELRSGTRVLFSGNGNAVASTAPDTTAGGTVITLSYVGPGAGITQIRVTPRDTVVSLGLTQRFGVSADSAGVPIDSFYVSWSTSNPASVPISTLGVLQAPGARGAVYVRAVTPNGVRDSTRVTFAPVPSAVAAVGGGGQSQPVGTRLPQPLRVRVTAADQLGVPSVAVRFRAVTGGGSVRDSVIATDSAGYAEDSVTLGSVAGAQTFSATVTGLPAVNFSATGLAGPISAATSVVTVSSPSVASGTAATLTLQAKDAFGNVLATGGATVTFSASGGTSTGTIGAVTDHGDGTYTASFVGVTVGTATTIGATVNGTAVTTTLPTIAVTAGAISAATSTVTVASPTVISGAAVMLTLQARDGAGNALSTGGATVVFTATGGTSTGSIGATTDHGDGTYTASFTGALAGTATTIGATINGAPVTSTLPTLTVTAGAVSPATSIVSVSSGSVAAGASVTLTLEAHDSAGNALTTGGATVVFTATGGTSTGTIGATTDHGDGTYTATFTGVVAGTATTIGATIDGTAATSTISLTVAPGNSVGAQSIVTVSAPTVVSGAAVTLTLQARDSLGNDITTGGSTVVFSHSGGTSTGTIGLTSDHGDGTYTASFTGLVAGTATTIGATIDGATVTSTLPTVTVTPGAISTATSLVTVSAASVPAGGIVTLTLQAKDSVGNNLKTGGETVVFTATGGTSTGAIGSTTDHGDGTYTASFTAATAGTATTIGATIGGTPVTSPQPTITVTAGAISPATSVVSVSADTVASGLGVTLTLQAKDSAGNALTSGGAAVVFTDSGGTSTGTIVPTPGTDNTDGTYTATFTGVLAGTATTIHATINGAPVTTPLPTIIVIPGAISTATSVVTVSADSVAVGAVDTLFLQGKDAAGNLLTTGGATVVFTQTGGTSVGLIGPTTDLANGRYRALFTGQTAGTATTIGATIAGNPLTSTAQPTIRVFATSTTHSADITADETWAAAQNPHIVTGYLRVRNGATLTIGAGALVKFDAGAGLQVGDTTLGEAGGLVLDGTGGLITLTANTASPTPGFWKGIELQNTLAVVPWNNVLIEWGGGTRSPAGTVAAEACLLVVNNSGAALVAGGLHIRQCNHAGIHHFGGTLTVRQSEIDSVTGSGIHEDFKATLELDTTRIVGSGQEGLLVASAVARLTGVAGNSFLNNGIASIHMYGHQLRGFKQQDSIAGNGTLGGFGDSIVVDSGLIDGGGTGFTLHHQAAPYLFMGPIKIINAPVMLSRGFTAAFAPGAVFQVGDSTPGNDAQFVSQGTVDSQVVLAARSGTGWPGVFLGRQSAPPVLHHVRIVGGGYDPAASVPANLLVDAAGGTGPIAIDSVTSESSHGHGIAVLSAPAGGFRVRDDSIRNSAGIGLAVLARGSAADSISGNVLSGNLYPLSLAVGALPGLGTNTTSGNLRDTLLLGGGRLTVNATLPYVAGAVWRATDVVKVDSGAVLTIAARDTVAFDTSAGIVVGEQAAAALAADGSAGMILFTASAPLPWGWHGVEWHLMSGSGSTTSNAFRYVDVDRAGFTAPCYGDCNDFQFAALRFTDSLAPTNVNLPVDHIIVRRSNSYALDFRRGGTGTVNIQASQFYNNLPDPMIMTLSGHGSQLTIGTSDLYHYRGQAVQGIYKSASAADSVNAVNNWWGDQLGVDTGFIFQDSLGRTSTVFGAVRTTPFATTPFFPVGSAAGVVTTQDSVLSPNPALSTADSIRVRVVDASGRGVAGQSVNWSVQPPTGSSVTPLSGSGDTGGRFDALWTFTTQAGVMVATATGPAGAAHYYADVQPALTVSGPNWAMLPALTQGTVPGARLVTFTSTNRRGVLVSNSVDQYGNATHAAYFCFYDPGGSVCQYTYGQVDSTHSGTSAGDTIFFHTSVTTPASYVLRGVYNLATGGQQSDSILITMVPSAAGVKIDRNAYDGDGVQAAPDTAFFHSICPGQSNVYCQRTYHAFVVDSGLAPVGNQNASFQWSLVPAAGAPVSITPSGVVANDSALVTALASGFVRLAVTDVSSNNYGTDTMPVLVHQLGQYILLSPDTASVLLGNTANFQGTVVDAGNEPLAGDSVHWRVDPGQSGTLTIVDTSAFNTATVRMDATPNGTSFLTAYWPRPLADTLFGYLPGDTLYGTASVYNPVATSLNVGPTPLWAAVNSVTNRIYVSQGDANVSVIDGATNTVSQVAVGYNTFGITVNPKTNRIYAAQNYGSVIYEIDGATNAVDSMGGPNLLGGITADSTRNLVYAPGQYCVGAVACVNVNFLAILDPVTKTLVDTVRIGNQGSAVAFNPVTDRIYVTTYTGTRDTVVVIDAKTDSVVDSIEVGPDAVGIAVNPVTNRLYVANATEGTVSVIDGATDAVIATVSIIGPNSQPFGLGVDPVTNRIYVSTYLATSVLVIDGTTNQVVGQISVGDNSTDAQPNPATGRVYVPLINSNVVKAFRYQ